MSLKEKILELREQTGMGMLDCKRALEETGGDMETAKRVLAEKWEITKRTSLISYARN